MPTFLPRNPSYRYFHVCIQCLRPFFNGRVEVWRSLRTADKDLADCLALQWRTEAKRLFRKLRRDGCLMKRKEIEFLTARWLATELDTAETTRTLGGVLSDDYRESQLDGLGEMRDLAYEALVSNDFRRVVRDADELLQAADVPLLSHDSDAFKYLCRRLLQMQLRYTDIETSRLNGWYPSDLGLRLSALNLRRAARGELRSDYRTGLLGDEAPPAKLFSEVVKAYHKKNPPQSPRSQLQTLAEFTTFLKVISGDKPINYITKADCRKYKEHLRDERQNKPATVSKWLSVLSGVFRWAERKNFIPENSNPVKGLLLTKKQAREGAEHYREFTDEELRLTFGSEEFREQKEEHPERYWICLLMLFQVCRRKESSQLNVADVLEEDGVLYIHFKHDGKDQTTKTESSVRKVPIHSALIQLGFLDYVQGIKDAGHIYLFPQLTRGKTIPLGDSVGKWFARLKQKKGVHDPNLTLYSTRHTDITRLSNIGVPEKIRMMITGHASQGIHGQVYDRRERVPMRLLQEGLERLQYSNVLQALNNGRQREEAA